MQGLLLSTEMYLHGCGRTGGIEKKDQAPDKMYVPSIHALLSFYISKAVCVTSLHDGAFVSL